MPLANHGPILVVVVTLLEMALRIRRPAGHSTNRQHTATLALFEDREQGSFGSICFDEKGVQLCFDPQVN